MNYDRLCINDRFRLGKNKNPNHRYPNDKGETNKTRYEEYVENTSEFFRREQ